MAIAHRLRLSVDFDLDSTAEAFALMCRHVGLHSLREGVRDADRRSTERDVPRTSIPTRGRDAPFFARVRSPYGRASRTMLKGVSAARRTRVNPPARITSRSFASPACGPRLAPTFCDREVGRQIMVEAA